MRLRCASLDATLRGDEGAAATTARLVEDDHFRQPGSEAVQSASEMHTRAGTINKSL
jgi:hypothetical protein